ncbi:MAG: N-6 DNA methylase [Anaerolineae bacterium]|jgi:hypothetical protein|nr:N-6 DNA methylase [Anaerolineae bacterium]
MSSPHFEPIYQSYLDAIRLTPKQDNPERQISSLFLGLLNDGFGIKADRVQLEHSIHMAHLQKRGFIDALFGRLVFEFKRTINRAAQQQLKNYLIKMNDSGEKYIGILTDGLKFETYILDDQGDLRRTDQFNLDQMPPEDALIRLDAYLFSQTAQSPTAADIVGRYGSHSPTFNEALRVLQRLLAKVQDSPMLETWRVQWGRLLSMVYGSNVGDDALFLRHTYLCQFARLLAYAALKGQIPDSETLIAEIIAGNAFDGEGVSNISENDFFSWVIKLPEIREESIKLFHHLAQTLIVYDLHRIDQDLLKQLYQNLVDPVTRHNLGEFYTPDWLAELTLREIDYRQGQSLLDPTCGSGTFLFSAIQRLAQQGLSGWKLVQYAVNHIIGVDVHPLAVTIARLNYLLALAEHMRDKRHRPPGLVTLPVYMADGLIDPLEGRGEQALVIPVDLANDEAFRLPKESATSPSELTDLIDHMDRFARQPRLDPQGFDQLIAHQFPALSEASRTLWGQNLRLLARLIAEDRNGIWSYILKNLSRPLLLTERKFDVIAGNPPWLSYRYIKNKQYQAKVKRLYQYYGLIGTGDNKLFTQMDLSTLFYAHVRDNYLKPGGTLAFVMPRSVITGAKQHRPFQSKGIDRVIDLEAVSPLFNVPTAVIIGSTHPTPRTELLARAYRGKLPAHELDLQRAQPYLTEQTTTIRLVDSQVRGRYYYERFFQGATLVPRNLCLVKPEKNPNSPTVITDPEADLDAKAPYKGLKLRGNVDNDYLYATLLSKHLVPFGYERLHLVALPARMTENGLKMLSDIRDFNIYGHFDAWDWFEAARKQWDSLKKANTNLSFIEQLNYRNKIVDQSVTGIKVLYNASGTNIASVVLELTPETLEIYQRDSQGFIADSGTYWMNVHSQAEAHYLCSLLNAEIVNARIKQYQSQGLLGERHVHRTPFEACAIPPFDPENVDHLRLAALSQEAHQAVSTLKIAGGLTGNVVQLRRAARQAVSAQLSAIDEVARRVLGL